MKHLDTFDDLKELSKTLQAQTGDVSSCYRVCWSHSYRIIDALQRDIEAVFGKTCYTTQTKFILEDKTYKQGASAVRIELKFVGEEVLTLIVECLIDIGRVLMRVKERPVSRQYEYIAEAIERQYNSEFLADIRRIQ